VGVMAFCDFDHATKYGYANRAKGARIKQASDSKIKKAKLEKLKTVSNWASEAQKAVNLYIRVRDKGKQCISCDKPDRGVRNASHYRSAGACSQLRFNTFNIFASCYKCNCQQSGNLLEYRIRLIKKIGAEKVEWLESQNEVTRYSIEYLKRVKRIFNKRAKHLTKLRGY
jgi:hypothetical protein